MPEKSGALKANREHIVPVLGSWPAEVSVTRTTWNNGCGLARAPLLASATASGLCRVDYLLGRFPTNKIPYGGIQCIRKEIDKMEVDGEDEDEN